MSWNEGECESPLYRQITTTIILIRDRDDRARRKTSNCRDLPLSLRFPSNSAILSQQNFHDYSASKQIHGFSNISNVFPDYVRRYQKHLAECAARPQEWVILRLKMQVFRKGESREEESEWMYKETRRKRENRTIIRG